MKGLSLNPVAFTAPGRYSPDSWDQEKDKRSASGRSTSPRRARHRRLGGTATEVGGKAVAPKEGVGGLLRTLDLGAIRYRDFQRNVAGGSRTTNPEYR